MLLTIDRIERPMISKPFLFTIAVFLFSFSIDAQIKLPGLVGDSMVLQRDHEVNIWGWATPGEKITVIFNNKKYQSLTADSKVWKIVLPAMKEGGPYDMIISGSNEITLKGILVGDVWVCSGQSNMEFQMNKIREKYAADVASSGGYAIRHFLVTRKYSFTPVDDVEGRWKPANPRNIDDFTAVGYFFAQTLYDKYKVPIGLIHSSWGGSPAEAWTGADGLKGYPDDIAKALLMKDTANANALLRRDTSVMAQWYKDVRGRDEGFQKNGITWADPSIESSSWNTLAMPDFWDYQQNGPGAIDGAVWLRKEISMPTTMLNKDVYVELGVIDDIDTTYFNGVKIGSTNSKYLPRKYRVPASLIKEGKNVLTVRVIDNEGFGGFIKDKPYRLTAGNESVSLTGSWQYKVGVNMKGMPVNTFTRMFFQPTVLFNAMINPLKQYTIKGVIWYQGESNASDPAKYTRLLPDMIKEWRKEWRQGDFPFLIVQLANYMKVKDQPGQSNWALLRESQSIVAATTPNCGLAVAIDLGETADIHPLNKKDVGYRLALAAEKVAYHESAVVYSGPEVQEMKIKEGKITLTFKNTGSGLIAKGGGELKQFAIAGADKKFVWATAKIEGNKVIVWSNTVADPIAVRYAWADNPIDANLYNKEGLPASPFRSDDWK